TTLTIEPGNRPQKRVPMTRLRARIAERLIEAQQTAAILSTFNEINMQPVMELRSRYRDQFEAQYGVRLGFMSFFVMAVIDALKQYPVVNASIEGDEIVYHGFFDIGVAIASPRGLVVPVLRDADTLSMAEIETSIKSLGDKAQNGTLSMEEITGGTFTITNGGVFGSLLSTPILNPPQSGILGMHKIEQRAVVEEGEVVVRPMMYVALSYDHRIIDGREAVQFLTTVKEVLEDPARLMLGV
ncbi:MAG: dihydrolipoyllysine-residue succinyltransferase, partial [Acidiferrobacterales bacterium]